MVTDEDMLTRLVRALADNAVRYTERGEVVLKARPAAGGVTLEVRDTGPGLDPELILETEDVVAGRSDAASAPAPRLRPPAGGPPGPARSARRSPWRRARPGPRCQLVLPDLASTRDGRARIRHQLDRAIPVR